MKYNELLSVTLRQMLLSWVSHIWVDAIGAVPQATSEITQ